mmetsp:Transcript_15345/g.35890  ORF Transcript_15345/g.35890 Transcript_15345/m.35890 type:complete len:347 (+) Transcript_15345:84-1124(+)
MGRGGGGGDDELVAEEDAAHEEEETLRSVEDASKLLTEREQNLAVYEAYVGVVMDTGMPRVQADGTFRVGQLQLSENEVRAWLKKNPLKLGDALRDPTVRATEILNSNGGIWTNEAKLQARRCFAVARVTFTPHFFELRHQAELRSDPSGKFLKERGVLLIHHACGSNQHVRPQSRFNASSTTKQRVHHGPGAHDCRLGQQYFCSNPKCPAVRARYRKKHAKEQSAAGGGSVEAEGAARGRGRGRGGGGGPMPYGPIAAADFSFAGDYGEGNEHGDEADQGEMKSKSPEEDSAELVSFFEGLSPRQVASDKMSAVFWSHDDETIATLPVALRLTYGGGEYLKKPLS